MVTGQIPMIMMTSISFIISDDRQEDVIKRFAEIAEGYKVRPHFIHGFENDPLYIAANSYIYTLECEDATKMLRSIDVFINEDRWIADRFILLDNGVYITSKESMIQSYKLLIGRLQEDIVYCEEKSMIDELQNAKCKIDKYTTRYNTLINM
jgi:hypothetical protein